VEPLAVSITPINETSAVRRINEVMRGHRQFRKQKFKDSEREISGKLTEEELLTFFERIKEVAKVRYNRKRLASFSDAQQVPFVLTLKAAPKTAGTPAPARPQVQNTAPLAPTGTTAPAPLNAR